jgi:hypothetical protein
MSPTSSLQRDLPYELSTPELLTKGQTVGVPSEAKYFGAHYRIMQQADGQRRLVAFNAAERGQDNQLNLYEYDEGMHLLHRSALCCQRALASPSRHEGAGMGHTALHRQHTGKRAQAGCAMLKTVCRRTTFGSFQFMQVPSALLAPGVCAGPRSTCRVPPLASFTTLPALKTTMWYWRTPVSDARRQLFLLSQIRCCWGAQRSAVGLDVACMARLCCGWHPTTIPPVTIAHTVVWCITSRPPGLPLTSVPRPVENGNQVHAGSGLHSRVHQVRPIQASQGAPHTAPRLQRRRPGGCR